MKDYAAAFARVWSGTIGAHDLRQAARSLAKSPAVVLVATLSIGLGVGVNATLYSAFRTVFLQPPTAAAPDRLVRIEPGNSNQISFLNFRDLAPGAAFEGLAAYANTGLKLRSNNDVQKISAMLVSAEFFEVLGVQASSGRTLSSDREPVVVVTHEFWQRRFSDRKDPLGIVLNLNAQSFTVVGVLPEGYRPITGALGPDIYVPVNSVVGPEINNRRRAFLTMFGRLRGNVTTQQAQASLVPQMQALERAYPADNIDLGRQPPFFFPVSGLGSWRTRDMPMVSLIAITSVPFLIFGFVLLIACVNVAGLLLARGAARRREIAIRLAMGASRWDVIRTLLAESFLLSALGSIVGLVLAFWLTSLTTLIPLPLGRVPPQITTDLSVVFYALGLMLLTTLICGLTPAIASTKPDLANALKRDAAQIQHRLTSRNTLVSGQIALSTLLLFVSTLFLRTLSVIGTVDPGFNIDQVITARLELDADRYPAGQQLLFAMRAVEAVQSLPGIQSASVTSLIPLGGDASGASFELQGRTVPRIETNQMSVGPNYFRTVETGLRSGREFNAADRAGSAPVAIVNEAFVHKYSLGSNAIGAQARSAPTDPWMEIVGVVVDSNYAFFGEAPSSILYRPILQAGGNLIVVARTAGPPAAVGAAVKSAIHHLDSSVIVEPRTMRDATSLESSFRRLRAWLLGVVGALGLGLALIGLYGTLSYTVKRRMPEIGIRLALGASRPAILWMILRSGFRLVAVGVTIGILLSIAATHPLSFLMSGIPAYDPFTIATTSALLLITGLGASYIPSRRAGRTDPMTMLRYE